jgi:hypothetical protein
MGEAAGKGDRQAATAVQGRLEERPSRLITVQAMRQELQAAEMEATAAAQRIRRRGMAQAEECRRSK